MLFKFNLEVAQKQQKDVFLCRYMRRDWGVATEIILYRWKWNLNKEEKTYSLPLASKVTKGVVTKWSLLFVYI